MRPAHSSCPVPNLSANSNPLLPQDFDSASLAKLAFGLASVGYDDSALYSAITQAAAEDLPNMSPADVSMILWACGEQGHLCKRFMSGRPSNPLCDQTDVLSALCEGLLHVCAP